MKLRERNEVSGEMGMQSMTDIIFILLMFFMMTSTLVHPSALTLSLPGNAKTTKKATSKDRPVDVAITQSGLYLLDGKTTSLVQIQGQLEALKLRKTDLIVTITPDRKAPTDKVVAILDFCQQKNISGVLQADAN